MFKRFWWIFPVTLMLGPLLGVFVGGVIAYISPKQYESTATIQVRPAMPSVQVLPDPVSNDPPAIDQGFFATEFEVIRAQATLDAVIDRLDLTTRWGLPRAEVLEQLRKAIDTRQIRGTDLIEIRVRTTNAQDSKLIAEAVSEAYGSRRRELETQRSERALDELQEAVREQEDLVEDKRKVLTRLIQNEDLLHRTDPPPGAADRFAELETEKIRLESQIESLLRDDGDVLLSVAAGLDLPENIVRSLHPQWLEAKRKLKAAEAAGLGESHPTVRQQRKIIESLEKDLQEGVVTLRETLRAQLELTKDQLEKLGSKIEKEKVTPQDLSRPAFDPARADFESAQSILEQLRIKLISNEMSKRIAEDPVIVHEHPAEATKPVSPNILLLLVLGAGGGLFLGMIAPFLLIPLAHVLSKSVA